MYERAERFSYFDCTENHVFWYLCFLGSFDNRPNIFRKFQKQQKLCNAPESKLQLPTASQYGILAEREAGGFSQEPDAGWTGQAEQGRGRGIHLSSLWCSFWLTRRNTQTYSEPSLRYKTKNL